MTDLRAAPARPVTTFTLDEVAVRSGRLVVRGRWDGVRGMRFVRPTLVDGERTVLAALDEKPWAPDGRPWRASFPWDGDADPDLDGLELAVAPSITVPLAGGATVEADELPAPVPPATVPDLSDLRLTAATAAADAERLRARLDEAETARAAAVRALTRATEDRDAACAEVLRARAETGRAAAELDRVRRQRDEAVAARDALDRSLVALRARAHDDEVDERPAVPAAVDDDGAPPLGVRRIPAVSASASDLLAPSGAARPAVTEIDVWAIRILGSVAAVCFITLLAMLARVF